MRFEVTVDYLQGIGRKVLTSDGHVVELNPSLEKELSLIGVSSKLFAEGLIDAVTQNNGTYSFFLPAKKISDECENVLRIFEIWISTTNQTRKMLVIVINVEGNAQITLLRPELYNDFSKDLIEILAKRYICLKITMPFMYRSVIFDTFNSFKRLFDIIFEGIINLSGNIYMATISNDKKALLWKIDSTNIRYVSNNLIPSELLRLIR
ncbi:conserved hypothetical protein [Sulfolobus islandicus L.S.2.15]|uniref:Uncharacterized protein n=1 Tax=Saccharolobus islandicus (strain L.S.2.15 / Lassen \|nr:hypothetical protein [Sulfolobus islandicus]ACP35764.1 conserved hypothetical protein [Sulfolobus islandicus L.S.2.15]